MDQGERKQRTEADDAGDRECEMPPGRAGVWQSRRPQAARARGRQEGREHDGQRNGRVVDEAQQFLQKRHLDEQKREPDAGEVGEHAPGAAGRLRAPPQHGEGREYQQAAGQRPPAQSVAASTGYPASSSAMPPRSRVRHASANDDQRKKFLKNGRSSVGGRMSKA